MKGRLEGSARARPGRAPREPWEKAS